MKKALVLNNVVVEVAEKTFPVSPEMKWLDCPDECEAGWKIVDNVLVEKTQEEIDQEQILKNQEITNYIVIYGDKFETAKITIDGFEENFTEKNRRNLKEAVDLLRELNAPETTTIKWNSDDYGVQDVSLKTMVAWLIQGGQKRQARYQIEPVIKEKHASNPYTDFISIENDFNQIYNQ